MAEGCGQVSSSEFARRLVEEARQHGGGRLKDDATAVVLSLQGE